MVKTLKLFVSSDDKAFDTFEKAIDHENEINRLLRDQEPDNFNSYCASKSGKLLLEKHFLGEQGIWYVRNPYLGYFRGTLRQVIQMAVLDPTGFVYGTGGVIEKIEIKTINKMGLVK